MRKAYMRKGKQTSRLLTSVKAVPEAGRKTFRECCTKALLASCCALKSTLHCQYMHTGKEWLPNTVQGNGQLLYKDPSLSYMEVQCEHNLL